MKKIEFTKKQSISLFILVVSLILLLGLGTGIFARDGKISMAVLPFENLNRDPEQDYLSGIIGSIVRQDLSVSGMVFLVDRNNMEDVLNEQKLQFTGVMDDKRIIETGRLVGAEYILKGGYVFLGQDLFLNLDLINTETGRSYSFSERGYQENTVHALTEKLILHLTGSEMSFQSDSGDKSIIAVSQQEPGRVLLFSPLIDARVYVDGEFAAYTLGDMTAPQELILPAGDHSIRTHLSKDFGVVQAPEVLFSDWYEEFTLESGQTLVLEDRTTHFNSILYDMQQVVRKRTDLVPGSQDTVRVEHDSGFTDREGKEVPIVLQISFFENPPAEGSGGNDESGGSATALVHMKYDGEEYNLKFDCPAGESEDFEQIIGKVKLSIDLSCYSEYRWTMDYSIWRQDIYQGLHREEPHQEPWNP
ncbi:MAG: CsgG/HfaB family protein [Spirochaetales bacterium]|nr:CsgG/HfaB family protein [Spirochaetales bacterium]